MNGEMISWVVSVLMLTLAIYQKLTIIGLRKLNREHRAMKNEYRQFPVPEYMTPKNLYSSIKMIEASVNADLNLYRDQLKMLAAFCGVEFFTVPEVQAQKPRPGLRRFDGKEVA